MKPLNEYRTWLQQLTDRIHSTQVKAALKVNEELIRIYWHLGQEILDKERTRNWGNKLIDRLSKDLLREFPHLKGFSRTNLYYVRQWVLFHNQPPEIVQQLVGQFGETMQSVDNQMHVSKFTIILELLTRLPWGHHVQIISKCQQYQEALFYIIEASKNNWSRNVLVHQIESGLWNRRGKAITNFVHTLPAPHSDLARELIKDPYNFDFLILYDDYKERDLESALMDNLTRFLLELGTGFSFVGRQYPVKLDTREYNIDLLFYHFKLHCFVVVELKSGEFLPEHAGKLNFLLNVVDDTLRQKEDNCSIELLICKHRNEVITEYALRGVNKPIGISEYQAEGVPDSLRDSLPTIQQIEEGLKNYTAIKSES